MAAPPQYAIMQVVVDAAVSHRILS